MDDTAEVDDSAWEYWNYWTQRAVEAALPYPRNTELAVKVGLFGYKAAWQAMSTEEYTRCCAWLRQRQRPAQEV